MSATLPVQARTRPFSLLLPGLIVAALALGIAARGEALVPWYIAFMVTMGLSLGSLGLLMIGHVLGEAWLSPVREELEAAALTAPLLAVLAIPLGLDLGAVFPWARETLQALPPGRAAYLSEAFFLARSAAYVLVWSGLALWIVLTPHPRRASTFGLALLLPTVVFAANDWAMSRDPAWWSSLFGFAFATSQLLGALAGAILLTLLFDPRAHASRLSSLERALLVLALLAAWIWFCQFLIVWLANLPAEAAWYIRRSDGRLSLLLIAVVSFLIALVLLLPTGAGRALMTAGSTLLLVHHGAHMVWILGPSPERASAWGLALAGGLFALWAAWFVVMIRLRPGFAAEAMRPVDG